MMTEQPFLPLFFNSEDKEIWEQLQKMPPEKRAETVKQALHEFFQARLEIQAERAEDSSALNSEQAVLNDGEQEEEQLYTEALPENELSLESLFDASPQEIKPDPLKNLLSVIGEEDDEDVLNLLLSDKKSKTEIINGTELKEPKKYIENNEMPIKTETIVPSSGLAYLLHNVIGEEEDEEVLQFFQDITEKKEE